MRKQKDRFIFRLSPELKEMIRSEARNNGIKESELVRGAVRAYFELPTRQKAIIKLDELLNRLS